jgi:hypothetical protein
VAVPIVVRIGPLQVGLGRWAQVDRIGRLFRWDVDLRGWGRYPLRLRDRINIGHGRNYHVGFCSFFFLIRRFQLLFKVFSTLAAHFGRQVMSTRTGISFLTGTAKRDGGSILKSDSVAGIVPDIRISFPCVVSWNGTCLYWAV